MLQPDTDLEIPSPYYRVSLKALILDKQARLLVMQATDELWELPGGGWEHGETMQHCLRRELMKELGVTIDHIDFTVMYPYVAKGRTGHMRLKIAIPITISDHDFILGDKDIVATKFVTASELAGLSMTDTEAGIKTHIDRIWPNH